MVKVESWLDDVLAKSQLLALCDCNKSLDKVECGDEDGTKQLSPSTGDDSRGNTSDTSESEMDLQYTIHMIVELTY